LILKFIIYWIVGYILFKIARTFLEPFFAEKTTLYKENKTQETPNIQTKKQTAHEEDYIEYTEVNSVKKTSFSKHQA
jgi:hypothetical protein